MQRLPAVLGATARARAGDPGTHIASARTMRRVLRLRVVVWDSPGKSAIAVPPGRLGMECPATDPSLGSAPGNPISPAVDITPGAPGGSDSPCVEPIDGRT